MPTHDYFLNLLIILLTARIFAEIASRMKSPPVIGELIAGVVLGPSLLGWIEPMEAIHLLAEIGIILLLFEVGMETDVRQLVQSGRSSVIVAVVGFVLPFVFGATIGYVMLDLPLLISLFIGGTLTATSIGITVRVLTDLKRRNSYEGQVVLGAAVIDDILGVILLAVLYEFAVEGEVSVFHAGRVLLFVLTFFVLAPIAAKMMSMVIRRFDSVSAIPGMIPTTIVSLVLFFAWLAHVLGAPELLGGFAAGLALSRRFFLPFGIALHSDEKFAGRIESEMRPIVHLFTPIFFVMVGLSLNLHEVDWSSSFIWLTFFSLLLAAIAGKLIGGLLLRESLPLRLAVGISMIPRGEVGLIFAELGRVSGVFDDEIYAALILVIAVTTLMSPFALNTLYRKCGASIALRDIS
ncbi:MAG: cation:proton antiporter [Gammaproteobacteria bacterium]